MEYDEGRTAELEEKGFKILRFKNDEVLNDIKSVLEKRYKVPNAELNFEFTIQLVIPIFIKIFLG